MEVIKHIPSEEAFTRILTDLSVPFHDWGKTGTTKPKECLYEKYVASEADFLVDEDGRTFITSCAKASVRLLRKTCDGLEYLAQTKIFWNGEIVPPSKSISVRGHRRARLGEDSLSTVLREIGEELSIPDSKNQFASSIFETRYRDRFGPLEASKSFPGTKHLVRKCSFQALFPEKFHQPAYEELNELRINGTLVWPGYRVVSTWAPITQKIQRELLHSNILDIAA